MLGATGFAPLTFDFQQSSHQLVHGLLSDRVIRRVSELSCFERPNSRSSHSIPSEERVNSNM